MQAPEIVVKDTFTITGRGAAVFPEQGLPPELFGLSFELELTAPDGSRRRARGSVESLLRSLHPPLEVFTYLVHGVSAADIPPGTIIRTLNLSEDLP